MRSMCGVSIGTNPKLGEGLAEARQHPLAGDHHRGRDVPQPAGHAGIDHDRRVLPRVHADGDPIETSRSNNGESRGAIRKTSPIGGVPVQG